MVCSLPVLRPGTASASVPDRPNFIAIALKTTRLNSESEVGQALAHGHVDGR